MALAFLGTTTSGSSPMREALKAKAAAKLPLDTVNTFFSLSYYPQANMRERAPLILKEPKV